MEFIKRVFKAMAEPFIAFSVLLDEDRRQNLDGRYNKYWARKNRREMKKAEKRDERMKKTEAQKRAQRQIGK